MATFSAVFVPGGDPDLKVAALTAAASSGEQVLGTNKIFAINADQDITIRFGRSGMAAADTTFFRIPANSTFTFDTGDAYDRIRVFNQAAASAANVYIKGLSRF